MMFRQRCVGSGHVLLDDDAASHSFDRTVKNCDETVAGGFDESAVMFCNARLDEVPLESHHATVRTFFIEFHETAVARDIASDDRHQTTGGYSARRRTFPARVDIANLIAHGDTQRHLKPTCCNSVEMTVL